MYKLLLATLFPFLLQAQGLQRNEIDRFTKQRVISTQPVALKGRQLQLTAEGKALYLQMSGTAAEAFMLNMADRLVLLLINDSVVTAVATGIQTPRLLPDGKSYQFNYAYQLSADAVELLTTQPVVAMRQYHYGGHSDVELPAAVAAQLKSVAAGFYTALIKEAIVPKMFSINLAAARRHLGDSVLVSGKVTNALYSSDGRNRFVQLQLGSGSNAVQVQFPASDGNGTVQTGEAYINKEITVQGRLKQSNGRLIIQLSDKKSFWVNTPVRLKDIARYAGDSVLVYGEVLGAEAAQEGTQLQLGGDDEPETHLSLHLLTAANPWPNIDPYQLTGKLLRVRGRVELERGRPVITVSNAAQID